MQKEFNKGYYDSMKIDFENKIALLSSEIERLRNVNIKQIEELNSFHREYSKLELSLKDHGVLKDDLLKMSQVLNFKIKEAEEWRVKAAQKESELLKKDYNVDDKENKIRILMEQIEKANVALKIKTEENINLNEKLNSMQMSLYELHSWKEKSNFFCDEIDRLNKIISENDKELNEWRFKFVQYSNLTTKINDQLADIVLLSAEIEALRFRVKISENQTEELRKSQIESALFTKY